MFKIFNRAEKEYPSVFKELQRIVKKNLLAEIVSSNTDPRIIVQEVAKAVGVPEFELIRKLSKNLKLSQITFIPSSNLRYYPEGLQIKHFRRAGAIALTDHEKITSIACVEPSLVEGVVPFIGRVPVYLARWCDIAEALDRSERDFYYVEEPAENKTREVKNNLGEKIFNSILNAVSPFSPVSVEIYRLDNGSGVYEFTSVNNEQRSGLVNKNFYNALQDYLKILVNDRQSLPLWNEEKGIVREIDHKFVITCADKVLSEDLKTYEKPKTVLAIDDQESFLNVLKRFVQRMGFEVVALNSAEEALSNLVENKISPDLVICDLHMAGIGGRGVVKTIRENSLCQNIPLIILTSDTSTEVELELINDGADLFLTKSTDPRIIAAYIKRQMEIASLKKDLID